MPRLSCWFIKAALLHLAAGVVFGGLILAAKGLPIVLGWSWRLLPAHIQLLVGGWLIQLALGMAYWILPRLDSAGERGLPIWATISFGTLNLGAGGAAVLLVLRAWYRAPWLDALLVLFGLLQMVALGAFAWHAWPRIRPFTPPVMARQQEQPQSASASSH